MQWNNQSSPGNNCNHFSHGVVVTTTSYGAGSYFNFEVLFPPNSKIVIFELEVISVER